jgi:diadenylate cyclase
MLLNCALASADSSNQAFAFWTSIKNLFSNFKPIDLIDILLLASLIFLVFRFIRSRKAGALIIGIIAISILTFVAHITGLNATFFVFSEIFDVGIIVLIIIFQPEIRDCLERLGSGSVNGFLSFGDQKKKKQLYLKAVDNVCAAVSDLSATKTGALIVISRNTKLDDVTETGITIDAEVNSFLLRNLFFNKAPLHDGAVVIDEGRISAAGCLLPLTRRTDIDSDLGTRHRAAIGMSETSDAIVVVVSEETGIISVAMDCSLTRNFNPETLRTFLMKKLIGQGETN